MKSALFIAIIVLSGGIAGTMHGVINLALVEPFLDEAINFENQNLFESGQEKDTPSFWVEYNAYRYWQKSGQVLAGAILGTSIGALFGIVYGLSKNSLPGSNEVKKALALAGIMWFTVYMIPFLKYPANPPTVGDPETVILREILYLAFISISGLSVLGFYQLYKRLKGNKKLLSALCYIIFIIPVFLIMPDNPDKVGAPSDLVLGFRIMSILSVSSFWVFLPLLLGSLWRKFRLDQKFETTTH